MLQKIMRAASLILLLALSESPAAGEEDDRFSEFLSMPGGGPMLRNPAGPLETRRPEPSEPPKPLLRKEEKEESKEPDWDLNKDGIIDEREVARARRKGWQGFLR